jgi:DNA-binding beta-propeller fold protein YncE
MKPTRAVTLALLLLLGGTVKGQEGAPLKLVHTIPLPGLKDGDFDHFALDVDGHRLFLTAEENGKVEVLDTNTNQLIHTIDDVKAPHAILYRKDLKKLFVVDGDASARSRSRSMPIPLRMIQPRVTCMWSLAGERRTRRIR